ncbi:ATP-binding protein [Pyxidicoccus parkwayensis]|uniref:ATP-binding protein n=1 Tax=Pyxidicoccus parkwayensis TaxID=2813578 RepID=A0ABX7NYC2_9BACT|nr:ATP-binding protein [Pyxidicoccus parkwaysis]QSQ23473.1 ATP-binding protein [Pyxidicoccus parkwaysis]
MGQNALRIHHAQEAVDLVTQAVEDAQVTAHLCFALVRDSSGQWIPGFGRIDLCREDDLQALPQYSYPNLRVISARMPGQDFLNQLRSSLLGSSKLKIDDLEFSLPVKGNWDARRYHSDNDYTPWPCVFVTLSSGGHAIDAASGPFVSAREQPYFSDAYEIIHSISRFRTFHFHRDGRRNDIHFVIWNYRGRISSLNYRDNELHIGVDGSNRKDLQVVGRVSGENWQTELRYEAREQHSIRLHGQPESVELALVSPTDEIVDLVKKELVLMPAEDRPASLDEFVDECLQQGECATIEYKPFILLSTGPKREELIETILAMANAKGGNILVGVDDHGTPNFSANDLNIIQGRDKKDPQSTAVPITERREWLEKQILNYGSKLRDLAQTNANRSIPIQLRVHFKENSPILIVTIPPTDEKPYMDKRDNSIWYRSNATNRHPSEHELGTLLAKNESSLPAETDEFYG